MPKPTERNPDSAAGDWYIDKRCIDCAAAREVAPGLIVSRNGKSVFARQPANEEEERAAWRAALLCPTASVGRESGAHHPPPQLFPQPITANVYRCGYNARASFGSHSYFIRRYGGIRRDAGNVMIDSPRFTHHLVEAFERHGGLEHILLTHRDDVADAHRYARQFNARVWIHEDDADAAPYATDLIRGVDSVPIGEDLLAIPVPGHTRGSVVFLWSEHLFSGDSLAWSPDDNGLEAFRDYCWYSWSELKQSLKKLSSHSFTWLLPGHGHSVQLDSGEMQIQLRQLIERM